MELERSVDRWSNICVSKESQSGCKYIVSATGKCRYDQAANEFLFQVENVDLVQQMFFSLKKNTNLRE